MPLCVVVIAIDVVRDIVVCTAVGAVMNVIVVIVILVSVDAIVDVDVDVCVRMLPMIML